MVSVLGRGRKKMWGSEFSSRIDRVAGGVQERGGRCRRCSFALGSRVWGDPEKPRPSPGRKSQVGKIGGQRKWGCAEDGRSLLTPPDEQQSENTSKNQGSMDASSRLWPWHHERSARFFLKSNASQNNIKRICIKSNLLSDIECSLARPKFLQSKRATKIKHKNAPGNLHKECAGSNLPPDIKSAVSVWGGGRVERWLLFGGGGTRVQRFGRLFSKIKSFE